MSPAGRERFSAAFVLDADPDALVSALPGCVATGEAPCYVPVTVTEHPRARLDATRAVSG